METQGVSLFGEFEISHYYDERFLHLMNFVLIYANSKWSCVIFNTQNAELDDLKSKVVDLIDYFSYSDVYNDL